MPKWNGGVIGVANNPTQSSAKGIWSLSEATKAIRAGLWPPSNAGADPYFENVTMLLSADGTNGAQNNTFLDSSTNNFTITRNGNTTQGTFTPFSKVDGRWSNYFDGTGDYLSVPRSTDFLPGANVDFTFEVWFYPTATPGGATNVVGLGEFGTNADWHMGVNSSLQLTFYLQSTTTTYTNSTQALTLNQWNHLAISRSGTGSNNLKLFVNGVSQSFSVNNTLVGTGTNPLTIGADNGGDEGNITGYLSNLRLVNGQGLYTANFTPTTSPLTTTSQSVTASNVELLTLQSNRFIDNSSNAATITRNGDVSIQTFSPFPTLTAYASGTNGGSGYFDGSGDYLTAPSTSGQLGAAEFTLEAWIYPISKATNFPTIWGNYSSYTTGSLGLFAGHNTGTTTKYQLAINGASFPVIQSTDSIVYNQWTHIAVVRNSSNVITLYLNGVANGTYTTTATLNGTSGTSWIGASGDDLVNSVFNGYISGLRVVKGTAVYTAAFTPPTAPLTAITNTSLLCNFTNGGIIDAAMSNDLETVGGAQISTTQSKFGGASMYFDGTGDYLRGNAFTAGLTGSGDFTIEGWVYISSLPGAEVSFCSTCESGGTGIIFGLGGGGNVNKLQLAIGNLSVGNPTVVDSVNFTTGAWVHFAAVRYNGTIYVYKNGTSIGTPTSASGTLDRQTVTVGAFPSGASTLTGYIDDLRITKGYARYTASFTAPVGPFNGFGD
jgi:hypothetical protein